MRTHRFLVAAAAALSLLAAAVVGSTGTASAASTATGPTSPTTAGAHSYSYAVTGDASTQSTGSMAWNNSTWTLTLSAKTGQLAAGSCVTVYFDWRSTGHHDARALRDCKSNDTYSYSFSDDNTGNLLGGPSRMGVCYGTDDTVGTCTNYSTTTPGIPMDWTPWPQSSWAYPCLLSWTRRAGTGTVSTFVDAHSRRRVLTGSTC